MKAISLWQPWASLWVRGIKIHETRHWPTNHRGPLLVHAAKKIGHDVTQQLGDILDSEFGNHWGMDLPRGAILGRVDIVACKSTSEMFILGVKSNEQDDYECGNFAHGRFAWEANVFQEFREPIPYRGAQGIFNVPDELVREAVNFGNANLAETPLPKTAAQAELFK